VTSKLKLHQSMKRTIVQHGAVVIVWLLDLQLPVQAVPSTAKFMGSNPVYGEMYSIQHYVIKFVGDLWQVGGFLRVLRFFPQIKLTDTI